MTRTPFESDETVAQRGEPRRHPPIDRHVRQHPGPSRKPACAAISNKTAALVNETFTKELASQAGQPAESRSKSTAFSVFPATGWTPTSRYATSSPATIPPKDSAMSSIVRRPVRTRGSRRIGRPLLTASIPVYVPAPML